VTHPQYGKPETWPHRIRAPREAFIEQLTVDLRGYEVRTEWRCTCGGFGVSFTKEVPESVCCDLCGVTAVTNVFDTTREGGP
jgi:hypothetical protein